MVVGSRFFIVLAAGLALSACGLRAARIAGCVEEVGPGVRPEVAEEACAGNKLAQFTLAQAFETGAGAPADPEKAVEWYIRAARPTRALLHADPAPAGVGNYGRIEPRETGLDLPGNPEAAYRLGLIYLEGRGVPADRDRAVRWLRRAAEAGHDEAAGALEKLKGQDSE